MRSFGWEAFLVTCRRREDSADIALIYLRVGEGGVASGGAGVDDG